MHTPGADAKTTPNFHEKTIRRIIFAKYTPVMRSPVTVDVRKYTSDTRADEFRFAFRRSSTRLLTTGVARLYDLWCPWITRYAKGINTRFRRRSTLITRNTIRRYVPANASKWPGIVRRRILSFLSSRTLIIVIDKRRKTVICRRYPRRNS